MRVLTVGNMYPPHHLGGYELIWRSAVHHLRSRGHAAEVLTTDHREREVVERDEEGVHRRLRWYWRDHGWPALSRRDRLELERANARVLDETIDALRPDVVSWWAMGGMSLSMIERVRRRGLPAVGVVLDDWLVYGPDHDLWMRTWRDGRRRPAARAAALLSGVPTRLDPSAAGTWLFISESTRRRAREMGGWELRSSAVAHAGIDPRHADPQPLRQWRWRLLNVGRIDMRKGIQTAVEALAELPEATLDLVGAGDPGALDRLRALSAEVGVADRVRFLGPRSRDRLPASYADADAVVFPVTWEEPWGLVPLEAMAMGRPVLATGRGGSGEYLRDGENAVLFAPGDAAALAAAVRRLAGDPALRARLREGGLRTAARYTEQAFNEQVEAALLDAAKG